MLVDSPPTLISPFTAHSPSGSQYAAIAAEPGPLLVLAGPGAGKTYCLIERIRFLIEQRGFDPARICAFTFTNKAAGEIASRLQKTLGSRADRIKRGTIHSFCGELLREFGEQVGLKPGFGIADEEYQLSVLRRVGGYSRWHSVTLKNFTAYRFRGDALQKNDPALYDGYMRFLEKRNLVDFDMLVLKAAELLRIDAVAAAVRTRCDAILVDEFQDLNSVQYSILRALAIGHRNIFVVGDDEQSIYSWAGADPQVFRTFVNDFLINAALQLGENRRCPCEIISLARRLVTNNTPIFSDRKHAESDRSSPFPITALSFATEDAELDWIIDDLRRDRETHALNWGDFALLYRTNEMGYAAESGCITAGIPTRLARGRALSDEPVVGYLVAALRVISDPDDPVHQDHFFKVVLPRSLFDNLRVRSEECKRSMLAYLETKARELPRADGDCKKIWRALYALNNLAALSRQHTSLSALVAELLSHRVGRFATVLEENHDELSDPAENEEVQKLAERILYALRTDRTIWIPRLGGLEIPLKGILAGIGVTNIKLGGSPPPDSVAITESDCKSLGIALSVFKAAQLIRSAAFSNIFLDFTAVDIETTDNDVARAEVVEIAAVRVRNGRVVDRFESLVKPRVPIAEGARMTHGIYEHDVMNAPYFEEVWPRFREFCGRDLVVAHNGYEFDFPILRRMVEAIGQWDLCPYDTLPLARELRTGSASLPNLARVYEVPRGRSHRAPDDANTLASVFLRLGEEKVARARKTAVNEHLDFLALAFALCEKESLCEEAARLRQLIRVYPFGRRSNCLEFYAVERQESGDETLPTVENVIDRLGGETLMMRVRADKSAERRYPVAMRRLRPLIDLFDGKPLSEQITGLLERVALSKMDGAERESARVNLLTLHSTKGLEFSRVYIVGAEDSALPGDGDKSKRALEEARRLLYVGMTRTKDRLILTRVDARGGKPTGGHRFLDEMGLKPQKPPRTRN
ncbi:MAG TPA: UvrD-helicase domain-containing protein [Gemmatimonadaceae bacterium]